MFRKALSGLALAAAFVVTGAQAEAAPIPVELVLAIDASGSISAANYTLQKNAYINVLGGALITTDGTIAIGVLQFANGTETVFNLTVIDSQADKDALVAAVTAMGRSGQGGTLPTGATHTGTGINLAQSMLAGLNHANDNQLIDVSTDGNPNGGQNVNDAMAAANLAGTTVNCLVVGGQFCNFANVASNINLGGFILPVDDFDGFEAALSKKIAQETGQVPEPAMLSLLGFAGAAFAARRRRQNAA